MSGYSFISFQNLLKFDSIIDGSFVQPPRVKFSIDHPQVVEAEPTLIQMADGCRFPEHGQVISTIRRYTNYLLDLEGLWILLSREFKGDSQFLPSTLGAVPSQEMCVPIGRKEYTPYERHDAPVGMDFRE